MCIPKEIIIISVKLKLLSEIVLQLCTSFEKKSTNGSFNVFENLKTYKTLHSFKFSSIYLRMKVTRE